jgi:carbonic anhydrase
MASTFKYHLKCSSQEAPFDTEEAMKKLKDGNMRYLSGKAKSIGLSAERRAEVAVDQHPFAVILSCSDSRVLPEIIFDQGIGDLFVVRTSGHVAENMAIGSIEYAVEYLGVRLILVLGHKRCGVVDVTIKGGEAPGHIRDVVEAIKPAFEKVKYKQGDLLDNAIRANVKMTVQILSSSKPILAELIEDGMVRVVGGYYDLDTGAVSVIYNPRQSLRGYGVAKWRQGMTILKNIKVYTKIPGTAGILFLILAMVAGFRIWKLGSIG